MIQTLAWLSDDCLSKMLMLFFPIATIVCVCPRLCWHGMYEHMSRACICARTYFTFERLSPAGQVGSSFLPETGWSWSSEQGCARRGHQMRGLFQLTPANSDAAITRPANQNPGQHQLQSRRPSARRTQTLTTSRLRPRNIAPDIGSSAAAHRPPLHRPLSDAPLRTRLLIRRSIAASLVRARSQSHAPLPSQSATACQTHALTRSQCAPPQFYI